MSETTTPQITRCRDCREYGTEVHEGLCPSCRQERNAALADEAGTLVHEMHPLAGWVLYTS